VILFYALLPWRQGCEDRGRHHTDCPLHPTLTAKFGRYLDDFWPENSAGFAPSSPNQDVSKFEPIANLLCRCRPSEFEMGWIFLAMKIFFGGCRELPYGSD
jgi:hypothetical protein